MAGKERTAAAAARHEKNRQANTARAAGNERQVLEFRLGGTKRPSKLVRQASRAEERHQDALRLKMIARHSDGGDAA